MAIETQLLEATRVVLCLTAFAYASWNDWQKREVSNTVWLVLAPSAFALTTLQFVFFSPHLLFLYALSFLVISVLSITLFYAGAFGGADAKALMCLALALPVYPTEVFKLNASIVSPLFAVTVFSNGVLLAALTVAYAVARNVFWRLRTGKKFFAGLENEAVWRKVVVFLTGYKVKAATLEKGHFYPLENVVVKETGKTERTLLVFPKDEGQEASVRRIVNISEQGRFQDEVWATPGLPLLIFITAGLIIALLFGDLIWILLRYILFRT